MISALWAELTLSGSATRPCGCGAEQQTARLSRADFDNLFCCSASACLQPYGELSWDHSICSSVTKNETCAFVTFGRLDYLSTIMDLNGIRGSCRIPAMRHSLLIRSALSLSTILPFVSGYYTNTTIVPRAFVSGAWTLVQQGYGSAVLFPFRSNTCLVQPGSVLNKWQSSRKLLPSYMIKCMSLQ